MGLQFSTHDSDVHLNSGEKAFVENCFRVLSQDKDYLKSEDLITAWSYLVEPELVHHVKNACFRSESAPFKLKPFEKHFYVVVKGSMTEKSILIATKIFDNDIDQPQGVITTELLGFVQSTVSSYFNMLNRSRSTEYESWSKLRVQIEELDVQNYSNYVIMELIKFTRVSMGQIEKWLCHHPLFVQIWKEIIIYLYSHMNPRVLPKIIDIQALPICNILEGTEQMYSVLSIGKVMFINEMLPSQYRGEWTLLFNSKIHGESFATLIAKICDKGPTILIVVDESDCMFGGFAPHSWEIGSKFQGDSTATLFTLKPKMDRFISSGHNTNFQYLNANQTTMPNGLGMGGQFGYWGLWLDDNFVTGQSSVSCSTFSGYSQMSKENVFQLQHLEVWMVGKLDQDDEDEESFGTILKGRDVDKFLLDLSGHSFRSVGLIKDDRGKT